ncbi:hypothetical protein KAFR_0B06490 [Kazachstania africana CBS 2517]|uniref:ATP synthase subunit epsilon, mitochondrial n=1 Tax=Kazachstania africana (strain ATCC 22294 / BCRC 22015 / CBS 2517 / CECT 1963 / NBRC 1671 / NRRL Y-8276) TaxID=1071382 RepID=H2ARE5_KAZAF|nr:hypothetical protein KAFR_0B06490 [Kazachstania africana CBS 2517]CCF56945.1 hypothetical protein KAFR_0B06490 [Kazachstania africana CBS 2517]
MSSVWRKAGLTYASYLSIASKTLREVLKTEYQTAAVASRSVTEAHVTNYKNGSPLSDPEPLQKSDS